MQVASVYKNKGSTKNLYQWGYSIDSMVERKIRGARFGQFLDALFNDGVQRFDPREGCSWVIKGHYELISFLGDQRSNLNSRGIFYDHSHEDCLG